MRAVASACLLFTAVVLATFDAAAADPVVRSAAAGSAAEQVAPAPAVAAPTIPLRLFVDLQDPHSRDAYARYAAVVAEQNGKDGASGPKFELITHHVPLARNQRARVAAAAAMAARAQDGEQAFVAALLVSPRLDSEALRRAAAAASLDVAAFDAARDDAETLAEVERERRAAVGFGVRAMPSALIGGHGVVGVPPRAAMVSALERARTTFALCATRHTRDCEREIVRRRAPASLAGLAALRRHDSVRGGSETQRARGVRGSLGPRWRLLLDDKALDNGLATLGSANSDATAVLFVDFSDPGCADDIARLLELRQTRPWLRIVLLPLAEHDPGRGEAPRATVEIAVASYAYLAALPAAQRAAALAKLVADEAPTDANAFCARVGVNAAACAKLASDSGAAVAIDAIVRLAIRVDGRPGALYINGRSWLGVVSDEGVESAMEGARVEGDRLPARRSAGPYARLVAGGKVRDEAEIDLDPSEEVGDVDFMVDLGSAAGTSTHKPTEVLLFVDFTRPASRAAFHALRLLREDAQTPVLLRIASLGSSAEPGVTPAAAALLVASFRGKALAAATELFRLNDPYDWRQLRHAWRKLGISAKKLGEAVGEERVKKAMADAAAAITRLDLHDEPVIYVGRRRYVGPIDENRIRQAVATVAQTKH